MSFLTGPLDVISLVVAAQLRLACAVLFGELVIRIQRVIAAGIKEAAVNLIVARSGRKADDRARCLPILGTVGVPDHLEFGDGVDCGIDQDGAVRSDVVVVDAVDQEQVVRVRIAVDGEVDAA